MHSRQLLQFPLEGGNVGGTKVPAHAVGTAAWALQIGSSVGDGAPQVVVDKNGDLLMVASFGAGFELGGESYDTQGQQDIFVAKLSPYDSYFGLLAANNGNPLWARRVGSPLQDSGSWVAGVGDQYYGAGSFVDVGSFLGKELTSVGASDGYLFVVALP